MTPAAYFDEMVAPTIAEFMDTPADIRRAYAACMFAWHFADAVHKDRGEPLADVRKGIAAQVKFDRAYRTVADVANMAKHLKVTRPKLPYTLKTEDTHVGRAAAFSDGTRWSDGTSWTDADDVVCTRDDQGNLVDVRWCVVEARRAIVAYLKSRPELGWTPPPAPNDPAGG
jgi:hypothetical protein